MSKKACKHENLTLSRPAIKYITYTGKPEDIQWLWKIKEQFQIMIYNQKIVGFIKNCSTVFFIKRVSLYISDIENWVWHHINPKWPPNSTLFLFFAKLLYESPTQIFTSESDEFDLSEKSLESKFSNSSMS